MLKITFQKLTNEEQQIAHEFFQLLETELSNAEPTQEIYQKFFALFVELCHQRDFNPNQLKLQFEE